MRKSIHTLYDFHVHISNTFGIILDFVTKIVQVNEFLWDQVDSHLHVFESVKRRHEIKVFNIYTRILSSWRTDYTVPHYFGGSDISGAGCELIWVVN